MPRYPLLTSGQQPLQPGEGLESNKSSLAPYGVGISAFAASGFIRTNRGRLWNNYLSGIRAVENAFPGAILKTFRTSEFLSPLESWNKIDVPANVVRGAGKYSAFLGQTFGIQSSYSLRRTGGIFGEVFNESGQLVGMGIQVEAGSQKGAAIADYYARISGIQLGPHSSLNDALLRSHYKLSKSNLPYSEWLKTIEPALRRQRLILGSRIANKVNVFGKDIALSNNMARGLTKAAIGSRYLRAKAATTAGRLNLLLQKPFELPVIGPAISKIPFISSLGVKPGTATQMFGRYIGKAMMIGGAWKTLEYLDYLRSEKSPLAGIGTTVFGAAVGAMMARKPGMMFSKGGMAIGAATGLIAGISPRFDQGLFYGAASLFTDLNVTRARVSEATGMTESLQRQERVTPGFVSLPTALAFGGVGALAAGLTDYSSFLYSAVANRQPGQTFSGSLEALRESGAGRLTSKILSSRIAQKIPGAKLLSKIKSPMALGFIGGVAAWQVAASALSLGAGNALSAIPGLSLLGTPEESQELEDVYSGRKEVAVRKGRWWEFGRCLIKSTTCKLFEGGYKEAEDIEIGDVLVGRNNEPAEVLTVFKRRHVGDYLEFSTAFDRDVTTKVTPNHIIPVLDKNTSVVYETEAENIKINSYVEIPIVKLDSDRSNINVVDIINEPVFVDSDRVYATQKNWYSGNLQKSGTHNIPINIELDYDFGLLMGYFLAEGNISFNKDNPTIIETVHAKNERKYVDDIIRISKKIFNITPTVRFKKTGKKTKEGCWIVRICSAVVAKLFRWSFYPHYNYHKYHKQIPSWCLNATEDFKYGLIEGYYRGDGHWDNTQVISSSKKFILEDLQLIAFSLGKLTSIGPKEENDYLGRWKLRFVAKESTNPALVLIDNRLFAAVRSIKTDDYDDIVYDFEVDHPDHLFVAGTFLVHNSSKYEGGRIDYYRPHMLERLRTRAYQKGLYGDESEKWEYSPFLHPIKALFGSDDWKYHYEQKYQYERPAPLTSTYGEDVPFIGPAIAATLGKIFKPRKAVRSAEWQTGTGEFKDLTSIRPEEEPAYGLGGTKPGAPVSPSNLSQLVNELNYRRREAIGLPGFIEGATFESLIGREEVFPNLKTIGTMGKETGAEYWLWKHLNLGGGLATTEPIRRFIPRTPSYKETYNPLRNTMPSWMPEDYFLDLKYGNPFEKIPEAEIRLPGKGYEALHPELKGLSPEEYPLAYRAKILGDVAMWSDEYKATIKEARRQRDQMSERERQIVQTTIEQVREKKKSREFTPYRFRPETLEEMDVTISDIINPKQFRTEEYGDLVIQMPGVQKVLDKKKAMEFVGEMLQGKKIKILAPADESRRYSRTSRMGRMEAMPMFDDADMLSMMAERGLIEKKALKDEFQQLEFTPRERIVGEIGEKVTRLIDTPLEFLTPMSPYSKLVRQRSAIEEYVASEAIGTSNAFWNKPFKNFIQPAINMAKYALGDKGIPEDLKERRDIQEYFDMLQWVKMSRLQAKARQEGDQEAASEYTEEKKKTLFGADVYRSPVEIIRALPRRERDFFKDFSAAQTEEERQQILELIPENEKRIYEAQWLKQEAKAAYAKQKANIATEKDQEIIEKARRMRQSEGFEYSDDLIEQWQNETQGKMPFDEWIRNKKAEEYFSTHSLPGAEWIGWNPAVDLHDIKLKTVEMMGLDHHDFDLWGQRKRALARKPYINEDTVRQMSAQSEYMDAWTFAKNSRALGRMYNDRNAEVQLRQVDASIGNSGYNIEVKDGRRALIESAYKRLGA